MIINESQLKGRIISMLRRLSWQWQPRSEALAVAKCGQQGRAFIYRCAICGGSFKKTDIALDHINTVVPVNGFANGQPWDWQEYISRMFCMKDGWRVLCHTCHDVLTQEQKEQRRLYRADQYKKKKPIKKISRKKKTKKKKCKKI